MAFHTAFFGVHCPLIPDMSDATGTCCPIRRRQDPADDAEIQDLFLPYLEAKRYKDPVDKVFFLSISPTITSNLLSLPTQQFFSQVPLDSAFHLSTNGIQTMINNTLSTRQRPVFPPIGTGRPSKGTRMSCNTLPTTEVRVL